MKQLIKKSKNYQLKTSKKYNIVKQSQNQNVFDFVVYLEILKYKLKLYIEIQKQNHFLNCLKFNIAQTIMKSTNISIIRFVLITQAIYIENAYSTNFDQYSISSNKHKFKNKKRENFAKTIVNHKFDNSTTLLQFNNCKQNNIIIVFLFINSTNETSKKHKY